MPCARAVSTHGSRRRDNQTETDETPAAERRVTVNYAQVRCLQRLVDHAPERRSLRVLRELICAWDAAHAVGAPDAEVVMAERHARAVERTIGSFKGMHEPAQIARLFIAGRPVRRRGQRRAA
jgi:hypothetical protein